MIEIEAQSYVGKSPILKGIGELYRGLWCAFGATRICRRQWRGARVPETASIAPAEPVIELPMILQNALIFRSERPGTLCE